MNRLEAGSGVVVCFGSACAVGRAAGSRTCFVALVAAAREVVFGVFWRATGRTTFSGPKGTGGVRVAASEFRSGIEVLGDEAANINEASDSELSGVEQGWDFSLFLQAWTWGAIAATRAMKIALAMPRFRGSGRVTAVGLPFRSVCHPCQWIPRGSARTKGWRARQ